MKKLFTLLSAMFLIISCSFGTVTEQTGSLFLKNTGQWNDDILFKTSSDGAGVTLMRDKFSFAFAGSFENPVNSPGLEEENRKWLIWNLNLQNINAHAQVLAEGMVRNHTNFIRGGEDVRYYIDVPSYSEVTYENIYNGIDLRLHHVAQAMKYDVIVKPGADVRQIRFAADGVRGLDIDRHGNLEINTPWGSLIEEKPYSYQVINGVIKEVEVNFNLHNDSVFGFSITGKNYDGNYPLVIDPVIYEWGTFVGTGPIVGQSGYTRDNAIHSDKTIVVTGYHGINFPTTPGVYEEKTLGDLDVVVYKLSPDGSTLLFSTFIGGSDKDFPEALSLNASGEIFITGNTESTDFPNTIGGGKKGRFDAFVCRLSADGTKLVYSRFLGGSGDFTESGMGIAVNNNNAWVAGYTLSNDFPVTSGTFDTQYGGGQDGFVMEIGPNGALIGGTFIGGSKKDELRDIKIHSDGSIYVSGVTNSSNFPTTAGPYSSLRSGAFHGVVMKLNKDLKTLHYSMVLGGTQFLHTWFHGMDINAEGEAFVVGSTQADDYPTTTGAYQAALPNAFGSSRSDIVVTRIKSDGSGLVYSTYIGRKAFDEGTGIAVSPSDEAYILGYSATSSVVRTADYPTTTCANSNTHSGESDIVISKLDPTGSELLYSSYYGGSNDDYGGPSFTSRGRIRLYVDDAGCVDHAVSSFTTHSVNYPLTAGVYQEKKGRDNVDDDHVVMKIRPEVNGDFTHSPNDASCGTTIEFTDISSGSCVWRSGTWSPTSWYWDFGDGTTSTEQDPTHTYEYSGTFKVKLIIGCPADTITKFVKVSSTSGLNVDLGADTETCDFTSVILDAGNPGANYEWQDGSSDREFTANAYGTYWVKVFESGSTCFAVDTITIMKGSVKTSISKTDAGCSVGGDATVNVTEGASPFDYTWNDPANQKSQTAKDLSPGSYVVKVVDQNNCTALDSVSINGAEPIEISTSVTDAKCGNNKGSATVNTTGGTGELTYLWDNGETTQTIDNLVAGNYSVTVSDQSGCTAVKEVIINNAGNLSTNTSIAEQEDCDRSGGVVATATVDVNGGSEPYTYTWNDPSNQTTSTAVGLSVGSYQVTITDSQGCTAIDSVTIEEKIQLDISVNAHSGCSNCTDGSASVTVKGTGTAPYTYRWDDTDQQTSATATGLTPGKYIVQVTDDKGCRNSATVTIGITGIGDNPEMAGQIRIFPNPGNGDFQIDLGNIKSKGAIRIVNVVGELVSSFDVMESSSKISLDVESGVYYIYVFTENVKYTERVIIYR